MLNKTQFEQKVQSMSAKELIMAMVDGLQNPTTIINMNSYGDVKDGVCFGCAATNAICRIAEIDINDFIELEPKNTMKNIYGYKGKDFIDHLENEYNYIRCGDINHFNRFAYEIGIQEITNPLNINLPELTDDYTQADLDIYIQLANSQ